MRLAEKDSLAPLRLFGLCRKGFTASPQDIRHALCGYWWLRLKNKFMRLAEKISLAPLRLFGLCQKRLFTASPQDIRHALCGYWWLRLKNKFMRLARKKGLAPLRLFGPTGQAAHYTTFVISFAGQKKVDGLATLYLFGRSPNRRRRFFFSYGGSYNAFGAWASY